MKDPERPRKVRKGTRPFFKCKTRLKLDQTFPVFRQYSLPINKFPSEMIEGDFEKLSRVFISYEENARAQDRERESTDRV